MARRATVERWRERVAAYEASGLTQREWSRRHGISLSALTLWIRRHRSATALVPIMVEAAVATTGRDGLAAVDRSMRDRRPVNADSAIEATVGALHIRVRESVDPSWLGTLLKSLA